MAATPKVLFRGAATTNTATTLYTTPSATTTIVSSIIVTNTGAANYTFTMAFAGTAWATTVTIPANTVQIFDFKQALSATNTITGGASNTAVNFHISGVEVA